MHALGVHGYPLPSVARLQARHLERVRSAGAECVSIYMTAAERSAPARWAARLRARTEAARVRLTHLAAPQSRLLAHDEARRREAVASVAAGIPAVAAAGAELLFVGPGGFHDQGPWWWHPENFVPASRRALVRSLGELAERAEGAGVRIVVEGYQGSVLESPAVMREVLDEVDSNALGANLDYVNFLSPPDVARFAAAFAAMVETLGPRVWTIHAKDAVVWPRLSSHVEECPAGKGILDLRPVIGHAIEAGVPVLVEHLRPPDPLSALEHVVAIRAAG
jgi:sugar phosphate isomerase/epimerase